jgi:hypothetical protein
MPSDLHSTAMAKLLERHTLATLRVEDDERLARADLRRQIGRLEQRLAGLAAEAFLRVEIDTSVAATAGNSRLPGLDELERIRDALVDRVATVRAALEEREGIEDRNRELLHRMLEDPAGHRWVRISRADVGEPGCGHWHSRPRLGPLGMLMGWWRVKVSSGCPLARRLAAVDRST